MGNGVGFMDKNSERNMYHKRISKIIDVLKSDYYCTGSVNLGGFKFRDGQYTFAQIDEGEWKDFDTENEFWGYRECYAWFRHSFEVPSGFAGKPVIYEIMPAQREWRRGCAQFIVYANGELVQGVDSNHAGVRLLDCAKGGEKFDICINAYTDDWDFDGKAMMKARLKTVDDLVQKLIYDLLTPLEVAKLYTVDDLPRVEILKALNDAVTLLDLYTPDRAVFSKSAEAAMALLEQEIYGKGDIGALTSCIGHTHIDVVWLWRLRQTRDKIGRSFSTVLKLMDEYPEYKFMSSQAQLYDYCKQDYPEVYEGIKKRVAEGRWEPEGSMWVESDTNVVSGESLVRQFLVGKRFFKDEFGVDNKIMWLPDVFGYSAAIPQIMKKAGIDYFMTTKISWNEYNKVPYDTFMWQGIDGSEVLAHFEPSTDHDERVDFGTTYNAYLEPELVLGGWRRYSQKDLNKNVLCSFGFGDGGGGPTVEMLEFGRRMEQGIPGCPKTKMEFSRDFFERLEKDVEGSRRLPTWAGELYLEFHRGTLTSQAINKRYNRKSENLYHDLETLAAIAQTACGSEYPSADIYEAWKIILLNQFHDMIPGSSIKAVYDDSTIEYDRIIAMGNTLVDKSIAQLTADLAVEEKSYVVFNTLGFARDDVVVTDMPTTENFSILDTDGQALPWQKTFDGKLTFFAKGVPAKGYKAFKIAGYSMPNCERTIDVRGNTVKNAFFEVDFDADMNIARLLHKASGRTVAPAGETLNKIIAYEDRPYNHDAWNVDVYFDEQSKEITDVTSSELVENGPVRAVWKVVRTFMSSTIEQYFIFYKSIARIDVQYIADWKEKNILLKADYPVDVNALKATFDIQFGNLERTTHNNTLWDFAQFEVVGHKWADLSDNSFGLAILNDCKYGWTVKQGHIMPSLLRCATNPNYAQDREVHNFVYSIYPHTGAANTSDVVKEGYSLNFPLYCSIAEPKDGKLVSCYSFISTDAPNVIIETVKKAEDSKDIVIRAYETWNKKSDCVLTFGEKIKSAVECNLMEEDEAPLEVKDGKIAMTFKPFEIKSIKVSL